MTLKNSTISANGLAGTNPDGYQLGSGGGAGGTIQIIAGAITGDSTV